jgi:hypothetical protein
MFHRWQIRWPRGYSRGWAMKTTFDLEKSIEIEHERFWRAFRDGDADNSGVLMGEPSGIIHDAPCASLIIETIIIQACQCLGQSSRCALMWEDAPRCQWAA